jgi:hypothetical protein
MQADDETIRDFRRYVALILKRYGADRYLSKNNNNILRLASIIEAFPAARILVPYRDPFQQAWSLLRQNRRFRELHQADAFAESYMRWLVHHEFGADHRPFEWGQAHAAGYDADTLDYWLAQWVGAYGHLVLEADRFPESIMPVSYEEFCSRPDRAWARISAFAGLEDASVPTGLRPSEAERGAPVDPDLMAAAAAIRAMLDARASA